jgi:hypothetical protein
MTRMFFALSLGFGGVILATQMAFATPQDASRKKATLLLEDGYGRTRANGETG